MRKEDLNKEQLIGALEAIENSCNILKQENDELRIRIKKLERGICGKSCLSDYENLPFGDDEDEKDALIAKLQDQHQQDCIKINQLHVTIDTLVDKYSRLRKTAGMD